MRRLLGGRGWDRERWWYQLAHVCQRWRNLILRSASHLGLCLVCTYGTPIADMLAHSPPLPLIIDYNDQNRDIAAEDEDEIILALEQHERVRRIRLHLPVPNMQRFITVIEGEYPILEYMIIAIPDDDKSAGLMLTETLQAPHLRHIALGGIAIPIRSRLLTTAVGLVALVLVMKHPSAYFRPNTLLHWVSFLPQLDTLLFAFLFPVSSRDVERQLSHIPIMNHVTLPHLRQFAFQGSSGYVETVVRWITAPLLENVEICFFNQLTISIPRLRQFLGTTENLRFNSAKLMFSYEQVDVKLHPREEDAIFALRIAVVCRHLDWQVSSATQIFNALSQVFSTVEHLTFEHLGWVHRQSSDEHNEVDRTEWRKLLRSFSNVKTLHVDEELVEELSRCLRLEDGELPLELLPELQGLTFSRSGAVDDAFTQFIDSRKNAGHPVTLTRR